ncbi:GFA family protein [uncultured Tateyamaria sp.]|uniref:GFA family protein n=1 Tax=uncultured Tateyamaria sp. TaxID=455651 RepID=UPI002612A2EB|nr:GFA family protein [uncultured Tateyamaria sp.]
MSKTGSCVCGAVRLTVTSPVEETGACHCGMCRKWSGGVFLGVRVPAGGLEITGEDAMRVYTSSPWAERAFCSNCGSSLFYRVTAQGPMQGEVHIGLGVLDKADGVPLTGELYSDLKPDGYSFAQETHKMTAAEVEAMFAAPPT